jgi:hypothetical protein
MLDLAQLYVLRCMSYAVFGNTFRAKSIAKRKTDPLLSQFLFGNDPGTRRTQESRQLRVWYGDVLELFTICHTGASTPLDARSNDNAAGLPVNCEFSGFRCGNYAAKRPTNSSMPQTRSAMQASIAALARNVCYARQELQQVKYNATACPWFPAFLEEAFVKLVKRFMGMHIVRL